MSSQLSKITLDEYLPIIKKIHATLEVQLVAYPDLSQRESLRIPNIERQYDVAQVMHSMQIIKMWLNGSPFGTNNALFIKDDTKADWLNMLAVIHQKIMEYENDVPVIQLTLSMNGKINRLVNGKEISHCFEGNENMKVAILRTLARYREFLATSSIQRAVKSTSAASIGKLIKKINETLGIKLQLPPNRPLIETVRNSGSRIDTLYNIILID